ncbi:ferredoxin [Streptococcus oralis]|uniref:Ferredoxin n=2 Tax=Streptococcus oralis TaxID=1303 RepID=A0A4Q2FJ23_STROR|nr:ferredoxin [Streptococcus oralis]
MVFINIFLPWFFFHTLLLVFFKLSYYNINMKLTLIPERCIACGLCQTYSELFDYHDNGIVRFYDDPVELQREIAESSDVLEAIKNCPTRALLKDPS